MTIGSLQSAAMGRKEVGTLGDQTGEVARALRILHSSTLRHAARHRVSTLIPLFAFAATKETDTKQPKSMGIRRSTNLARFCSFERLCPHRWYRLNGLDIPVEAVGKGGSLNA